MSGLRSVEAKYNLNPEDLEEIMTHDDWDEWLADWKYVAAVVVGLLVGVVLAVLVMIFMGV